MTTTPQFRLQVWKGTGAQAVKVPATCTIELRCLPGASGIHLVLSDAHAVRLRAEVVAEPGEIVPFRLEMDQGGAPYVSSRGRNILFFPIEGRYEPPSPISPAASDAPIDIAIVIDGSLRSWQPAPQSARLRDHEDLWTAHVDKLAELVEQVAHGRDARVAVLAFGDQKMPSVTAEDLLPRYQLYPVEEELILQPLRLDRLREKLLAIPSTSGGDFVDALADALAACVALRWREEARKLLVLSGDSPGCSILHPLPKGADLCVRQRDVDTQALYLQQGRVEVLTIYHAPPTDLKLDAIVPQGDLLKAAQEQYIRLASLPELAFEAAAFAPALAAESLKIAGPIARGAAVGELVRVVGVSEPSPVRTGSRMSAERVPD